MLPLKCFVEVKQHKAAQSAEAERKSTSRNHHLFIHSLPLTQEAVAELQQCLSQGEALQKTWEIRNVGRFPTASTCL